MAGHRVSKCRRRRCTTAILTPSPIKPEPETETEPEIDFSELYTDLPSDDEEEGAIVPTDKDFESDRATWSLYVRCVIHNQLDRTPQEMRDRFIFFKKIAKRVLEMNKRDGPGMYGLSVYFDITDEEEKEWLSQGGASKQIPTKKKRNPGEKEKLMMRRRNRLIRRAMKMYFKEPEGGMSS